MATSITFILGLLCGILIVYVGLLLQVAIVLIPIRHIQTYYYKYSSKALEKLNDAKFERDLKKAEHDVLNKPKK